MLLAGGIRRQVANIFKELATFAAAANDLAVASAEGSGAGAASSSNSQATTGPYADLMSVCEVLMRRSLNKLIEGIHDALTAGEYDQADDLMRILSSLVSSRPFGEASLERRCVNYLLVSV